MNVDLDNFKWWCIIIHRFVTGIGVTFLTLDRFFDRFWKVEEFVERRTHHERRHMNILEVPKFIEDVVKLANDIKAAEALLAPQFPQIVADAVKLKNAGESLLGLSQPQQPV